MTIAVVIPSWNPALLKECLNSFWDTAVLSETLLIPVIPADILSEVKVTIIDNRVVITDSYLGVLPAMDIGGASVFLEDTDIIGFVHDDVEMLEWGWDERLWALFNNPNIGLAGFGGAKGLGEDFIYQKPYELTQLVRKDFRSNMVGWKIHGSHETYITRVAVLDGFSQFFRYSAYKAMGGWAQAIKDGLPPHHMYDAWAACRMKELGLETWLLPLQCWHKGGMTATSAQYDTWLKTQGWNNDSEVHAKAHEVIYNRFRNVLPLRT